jgi:hypothetical protein
VTKDSPDSKDPRFAVPLRGVPVEALPQKMQAAFQKVLGDFPPGTGVILFAFDFGNKGGMAYISNAERESAVQAILEWVRRQEGGT